VEGESAAVAPPDVHRRCVGPHDCARSERWRRSRATRGGLCPRRRRSPPHAPTSCMRGLLAVTTSGGVARGFAASPSIMSRSSDTSSPKRPIQRALRQSPSRTLRRRRAFPVGYASWSNGRMRCRETPTTSAIASKVIPLSRASLIACRSSLRAALASLCAGERDAIGLLRQVVRRVKLTLHQMS
jgi:hypothetical protein